MKYTIEQAEAQFEQLIEKAEAGEEVLVLREDRPIARLLAVDVAPEPRATRD